jgi:D-amino-acid dehydrogenase
MNTLVLGAGVTGITTAYYLAKAGHKVTVIERQQGAALETSFANGGQISACHTEPWATPATLIKIIKWLGRNDAPLRFRLMGDPKLWSWCARFLFNCTHSRALINTERMLRVALYSRDQLTKLKKDTGIAYDQLNKGILHIYKNPIEHAAASGRAKSMNDLGLERHTIDTAACVALEPALKSAADNNFISGGIFTPSDESGNTHAFSTALAELCISMGVEFHYNSPIKRLIVKDGRFKGLETEENTFESESCVVALGSYSPLVLKPLGINLPVYPAKGYSVTLPITNFKEAPHVSLIQDELKLVYSRLGNNLRVAGMAEIAGYNTNVDDVRSQFVLKSALALFPGCGTPEMAEFWSGLRPQTPDSVPVLGSTKIDNLYLNTGHSTLGWTMACGSGKILADLISGKDLEIDLSGLEISRFS